VISYLSFDGNCYISHRMRYSGFPFMVQPNITRLIKHKLIVVIFLLAYGIAVDVLYSV